MTRTSSGNPPRSRLSRKSSSIEVRKAASVLPEPVGAAMSVLSPRRIAFQPSACASVDTPPAADVRLHAARPGDRYLLCSDGLSAVVPTEEIQEAISAAATPEEAVETLSALVTAAGAPDNVTCAVADVTTLQREERPAM